MELIRGFYNLRHRHRGCAVTIGNFDGVHAGHQFLVDTVCHHADERQLRACVVSFDPLPVEYFLPADKHPPRLTGLREKATALANSPLDQLLLLRFNRALAETSAQDFIKKVLVEGLDTQYLMVGDDFQFGKNREGDFALLEASGKQYGFTLQKAETVLHSGKRVSSTRIRELLTDGALDAAAELLGRHYALEGRVEYGAQLGRTIGFPTANIGLKNHRPPLRGVFAVEVSILPGAGPDKDSGTDSGAINGIANIGIKPTVNGERLSLEVHLMNFSGDLYGQRLRLKFLHKLRDEKKFSGLDELKAAIATDEQNAILWFSQQINQ